MVINIKSEGKKINLWLPTSLIKSKIVKKLFLNPKYGINNVEDFDKKVFNKLYKAIIQYKRINGHFYLVDIQSADGDVVKIKV